jgi:hypothetical protein
LNFFQFFWWVQRGWCVGLTTSPPSMSRLSRQCGILNIPQSYRPPRPVMRITLLFTLKAASIIRSFLSWYISNTCFFTRNTIFP